MKHPLIGAFLHVILETPAKQSFPLKIEKFIRSPDPVWCYFPLPVVTVSLLTHDQGIISVYNVLGELISSIEIENRETNFCHNIRYVERFMCHLQRLIFIKSSNHFAHFPANPNRTIRDIATRTIEQ